MKQTRDLWDIDSLKMPILDIFSRLESFDDASIEVVTLDH